MSASAADTDAAKAVDSLAASLISPAQSDAGQPSDSVPLQNIGRPTKATDVTVPTASSPSAPKPTGSTADSPRQPVQSHDAPDNVAQPLATELEDEASVAIGPAQDSSSISSASQPRPVPVCHMTLLLTSGNRHPFKIDAKYLTRRNVVMPELTPRGLPNPFSISVYTLKELILREWRSEWEPKPSSPSSIRLIHFGKLLEDKDQLRKYQFSSDAPNVVHMSIRPHDLDEDETRTGGKSIGGGGDCTRSREGRSCCVIF